MNTSNRSTRRVLAITASIVGVLAVVALLIWLSAMLSDSQRLALFFVSMGLMGLAGPGMLVYVAADSLSAYRHRRAGTMDVLITSKIAKPDFLPVLEQMMDQPKWSSLTIADKSGIHHLKVDKVVEWLRKGKYLEDLGEGNFMMMEFFYRLNYDGRLFVYGIIRQLN